MIDGTINSPILLLNRAHKYERFKHSLYHHGYPGYTHEYSECVDARPGTRGLYVVGKTDSQSIYDLNENEGGFLFYRLTTRSCTCIRNNLNNSCRCCETSQILINQTYKAALFLFIGQV